jgi:Holliday junction resolvasome RuvABC ATP-dependent DNA helicase subunit
MKTQGSIRFIPRDASAPSLEERKHMAGLGVHNPNCRLNKYIGNEDSKNRLRRAAVIAFERHNHSCADKNYALFGPAGVGKTTLPALFAETVGLPFIKMVAGSIQSIGDVLQKIDAGLSDFQAEIPGVGSVNKGDLALVPFKGNDKERFVPPCVVLIDEVHDLAEKVVNGLLTATENADRYMVTENGIRVDTSYICWIIATTNREMLFDPFDSRFTKLFLRYYTTDEMSQIIQLKNQDWSAELCHYIARYASRIPREADDFAKDVREEMQVSGKNWKTVVDEVARQNEIELIPDGDLTFRPMTKTRRAILKALAEKGPISLQRLQYVAGENSKTLTKYTLPWLMEAEEPLITCTSKGYCLTQAGLNEAKTREICCSIKAIQAAA